MLSFEKANSFGFAFSFAQKFNQLIYCQRLFRNNTKLFLNSLYYCPARLYVKSCAFGFTAFDLVKLWVHRLNFPFILFYDDLPVHQRYFTTKTSIAILSFNAMELG